MTIRKELIDELIATSGGSLIGPDGLVKELTKALVERMLAGELNHHLGYEKHEIAGYGTGNSRNGKSQKTLKGEAGEMTIEVPRDRNGTFEPKLIDQTRFEGFDEKILSMYALGMTVRDIQGHLHDMYGVEVSPALISEVTDSGHAGTHPTTVPRIVSIVALGSRSDLIGRITLNVKCAGARSAGNPHATCEVAGAGILFPVRLKSHASPNTNPQ